jgi:hypothetical protein
MHYPANPLSRVRGVPDAATTAAVLSSCRFLISRVAQKVAPIALAAASNRRVQTRTAACGALAETTER